MDKTIFTNQTFKIALKLYKKANREMVVNINKTELAKETELSRPTIIAIIKDLEENKFIQPIGKSDYYITPELLEFISSFEGSFFKPIKLLKIHELIQKNAHEFCEREKDNNTIIGYVLYGFEKFAGEEIKQDKIYDAIEVYLYLKYHTGCISISDMIGKYLFENQTTSRRKNVEVTPYKDFLTGVFGPDIIQSSVNEDICRDFVKDIYSNFENGLIPHYLFQVEGFYSPIEFIACCVFIDVFLHEHLKFMDDSVYRNFNLNPIILVNNNHEAEDIMNYIHMILNSKTNRDFKNRVTISCNGFTNDKLDIEEDKNQINITILTKDIYCEMPELRLKAFTKTCSGFYVLNGNDLMVGEEYEDILMDGMVEYQGQPIGIIEGIKLPGFCENSSIISVCETNELSKPISTKSGNFRKLRLTNSLNLVYRNPEELRIIH